MFGSVFGKKKRRFASPFVGELRPITEAPDEAFAEKMNGDGFMVSPSEGVVVAPADSVVNLVFETKHALGLTTADGLEYMIHVGIDTVVLKGEGFTAFVSEGQKVTKGEKLLSFDVKVVRAKAKSDACLCVFTDLSEKETVRLLKTGKIGALEEAAEVG